MKKTILFSILALAFFSFMVMGGCKEKSTEVEETITSAEDHAATETEFASVFEYVNSEGNSNSLLYNGVQAESKGQIQEVTVENEYLPPCAKTTVDTATKTLTIDFGTTDCLCKDGMYRRGKIIANFNGKYRQVGNKVIIHLQDYYVNFKHYEGTKQIERTGDFKWSIKVTAAKITTDNGTISWNSDWTIEKTEGTTTATIWDDKYKYTGSANGTNRTGINFTVTIDVPLIRKIQLGCFRNFVAGILTIKNDKGGEMNLNYDPIGGEPCDKIAQVTINGKTKIITLR